MIKSETIAELAKALAAAQGEIENASKNAANPHFKSKYADLAEVLNTVRPVFSKHGLSFVQMPSFDSGIVSVETLLMHASGEHVSHAASAPVTKQDAQGVGSVITYLRRYSLAAFAGVAQEDDDANASIAQQKPAKPEPKINEGQIMNLDALISEVGADKQAFLNHMKLKDLADMPASWYQASVTLIEKKRAAQ